MALGIAFKFYTSVVKGLALKVKKFWLLIPAFLEVTREILVEGAADLFISPPITTIILNKVNSTCCKCFSIWNLLLIVIHLSAFFSASSCSLKWFFFKASQCLLNSFCNVKNYVSIDILIVTFAWELYIIFSYNNNSSP